MNEIDSKSDKSKQGLDQGFLECFGLNSAEGYFIFRLWKKQRESISVWCAYINSFKGKVSLAPRLSYLAALHEGTPDFGCTSVTSGCGDRFSRGEAWWEWRCTRVFSIKTIRRQCLQQRAGQVKYFSEQQECFSYWKRAETLRTTLETNMLHTGAHKATNAWPVHIKLVCLESLLELCNI